MKIAITGAAGFIGRNLVSALAALGHDVLAIDNEFRGSFNSLGEKKNIKKITADVLEEKEVIGLLKGCDAVYHLAAINGTRNFYEIPEKVLEVGLIGTYNVLKSVLKNNVKSFFFASSSEVYNNAQKIPTPENIQCIVPDVLNPRFSYGGSKICGELLTINLLRNTDVRYVIFRPHNVYGPEMGLDHVIPELVMKLTNQPSKQVVGSTLKLNIEGNGKQTRAFIFIVDAIRAIVLATIKSSYTGIIHIGTEDEITIEFLVKEIAKCLGVKTKLVFTDSRPGGPNRRCPDTAKLQKLGFKNQTDLHKGLKKTVSWYKDFYNKSSDL